MKPTPTASDRMSQADMDRLYDDLATLVDHTPKEQRERVLARLAVTLIQRVGSYEEAKEAINLVR